MQPGVRPPRQHLAAAAKTRRPALHRGPFHPFNPCARVRKRFPCARVRKRFSCPERHTLPKLPVPNAAAAVAGSGGRGMATATTEPYLPHSSCRSWITCAQAPQVMQGWARSPHPGSPAHRRVAALSATRCRDSNADCYQGVTERVCKPPCFCPADLTDALLAPHSAIGSLQAGQPAEPSARLGGLEVSGSAIEPYSCPVTSTFAEKKHSLHPCRPMQVPSRPCGRSRSLTSTFAVVHVFPHVHSQLQQTWARLRAALLGIHVRQPARPQQQRLHTP